MATLCQPVVGEPLMSQPPLECDDIYFAALELSPDARTAYLDEACREHPELRRRVEKLLAAQSKLGSFLQQPAIQALNDPLAPTLTSPTITERPGTLIGPYKLLQEIGAGGMGTVFMAEQTAPVKRTVALKVIKPG